MVGEWKDAEFMTEIISSGRVTIPSYIMSRVGLEEGTRVHVKIGKARYEYIMLYKDKEADKIEMAVIVTNSPSLYVIKEKGRQLLEGKSTEWATCFYSNWVIEPETIESKKT